MHIIRKQYLDGSIPTGFQRSAILGVDGEIQLGNKKVRTGNGAGREDVNVSCRGGTRVEIKGVSHNKWILGTLTPLFIPVSNIEVHPAVGCILYEPVFKPDKAEVKSVIETPLDYLLRPGIVEEKIMVIQNTNIRIPYYNFNGRHIWGATAMILSEFLEVIKRKELIRLQ
ncbi:hypothetical protein ES705_17281 [subsurface metagenome]